MAQTINVSITPGLMMPTLQYSQGDIGRAFRINITSEEGYTVPEGATAVIQATKPSGFGFSVNGVVTDNSVDFETTEEMTDEYGRFPAEIKITNGTTVLFSANFWMLGERNTHPEGTTDGTKGTVIPELTLLVQRIESAAEAIQDLSVEAETLNAGTPATAVYDESNNKITFGIPKGKDGFLTDNALTFTDASSDGNVVISVAE